MCIMYVCVFIEITTFYLNPQFSICAKRKDTNVVAKYSDFGLPKAVSRKRCNIGGKLVLITNRKSYMSFRLVPKSVTLNDLERRNCPYFALFHRIR